MYRLVSSLAGSACSSHGALADSRPGGQQHTVLTAGLQPCPACPSHHYQSTCLVGSGADGSEDIADDALVICNRRFHVVTAVLMLLRMLEEYAAFQECVPSHASEAARRAIELLKVGLSGSLGAGNWPPGLRASTCQRGCHAGLQAAWAHFLR